jgi:hypothetical protein
MRNYYDVKTGLKVRTVFLAGQEGGSPETVADFSDYQEIAGGVKLPFTARSVTNGSQVSYILTLHVKKVTVNSGLSDEEFK